MNTESGEFGLQCMTTAVAFASGRTTVVTFAGGSFAGWFNMLSMGERYPKFMSLTIIPSSTSHQAQLAVAVNYALAEQDMLLLNSA